jgi:hypothetical protein
MVKITGMDEIKKNLKDLKRIGKTSCILTGESRILPRSLLPIWGFLSTCAVSPTLNAIINQNDAAVDDFGSFAVTCRFNPARPWLSFSIRKISAART